MKPSLSKPVLAFLALSLALIGLVVWLGLLSRGKVQTPAPPEAPQSSAQVAVAAPPAKSLPAPSKAPEGLPAVIPISLTNVLDAADQDLGRSDVAVHGLPTGTHSYGGIEFWLQGLVQLQGQATKDEDRYHFRSRAEVPLDQTNLTEAGVVITQRGSNIATIYLLGATRYTAPSPGEVFANLILHYADGSTATSDIKYDVDLRDWWRIPYEDPKQLPSLLTRVAWSGPNPTYKDHTLRLYRIAFLNPHLEKVIRAVEWVSTMKRPSLFVAALTLDPLVPGMRQDDLTSAEVADPELDGQLQLLVQDTTGKPLPRAQVTAGFGPGSASSQGRKYTTDNSGLAIVRFPDHGLEALDVSAALEGFSGRQVIWDLQAGDTIPATYTLKLTPEVVIGGTVVDMMNNPITGATIGLYRFWSGIDDDPSKKGEHPSFSNQEQTTDEQGHWQAKGLPPSLLDHIGFDVRHPDFVGTNFTVGANSTIEKQLRAGTHVARLQRGLDVHGRVLDSSDNPVSGAKVAAGRKYFRERKETTSDDRGRFSFHSVAAGDVLFSVMADRFAADNQTVNVNDNMGEIVFRLKAGSVIRAHVQDESGQALGNSRVGLEGNPGEAAYDAYSFSTTTDDRGNFVWDGAPNETMPFYFFHDGFEAKRNVKLAPNQDNTVTLRLSRQLQGQVIDASTEQPVTKFSVRTGHADPSDSNVYGVIRNKEFSTPDGTFSMSLEEEDDNAVAVYADAYANKIERFPEAQNGIVQVLIRLKPTGTLSGVVLAPDGTPAPGVTVCVAAADTHSSNIQLSGGRLHGYDPTSRIATTDAEGHFSISSLPDDGIVVAAGSPGFGRAPLQAVQASGFLTLQAWGRIEGTLKIGGKPGVGKDLLYSFSIPGIYADFNGYKSTTDDQGQFAMEQVPPGDGSIVRLIQTSPNSWSHSDSTPVTVKSGETTQVTLGDNGAVVLGRVRFDRPPTNDAALIFQGNLSSPMPQPPAFESPEAARAYFRSAEWQAMARQRKSYTLEIKPDGSFEADGVVPGVYSLNIYARLKSQRPWEGNPLAQGTASITVPDTFDPATPIDLGEVVLKTVTSP